MYGQIDPYASHVLTTGESTISRANLTNGTALISGNLYLTYFTAAKTEVVNNVNVYTGSSGATNTTLCQVGIYNMAYSIFATGTSFPFFFPPYLGDLYLVTSTPNDTTFLASATTKYTKALSAPWYKERGMKYAVGVLYIGTGSGPSIMGQLTATGGAPILNEDPIVATVITGQTQLVGYLPLSARQLYAPSVPSQSNPGITNSGSTAIGLSFGTNTSGNIQYAFSPNDVGLPISGTNIPGGAIVTAWNSFSSATISAAATGNTTTGQFTVGPVPYSTTIQPRVNYIEMTR